MYKEFFGLKEAPFTISPNPRYLFMSARHRDALAHLLYGIGEGGGFVLLTGEVGTGKTTICRCLLEQLPKNVRLAYILNPKLNSVELMATMCDELGIAYEKGENSLKTFTDLLSQGLLSNHRQGLNTVLMVDEAQNLSVEVLEQIRLLTNLETNQKKLLQIILIGQPELQELLAKKELRQLAQRITARYHLRPLSVAETKSYIEHRLRIAGSNRPFFKDSAIKLIHKSSKGVPRLINVISDRSMLGAFSEQTHKITPKIVQLASDEVMGKNALPLPQEDIHSHLSSNSVRRWQWLSLGLMVILMAVLGYFYQVKRLSDPQANVQEFAVNSEPQSLAKEPLNSESQPQEQESNTQQAGNLPIEPKNLDQLAKEFWGKQSWDRNGNIAAKNLLALWGVEYLPFQSPQPCQFAESYTLGCDQGFSDWTLLSRLNRPTNLKLHTDNSGAFWATLLKIEGDQLTLQFGDNQVQITKSELNPLWSGEYQLFWKKPQGFNDHLSVGSSGQAVSWLRQQVMAIDGIDLGTNRIFTQPIQDWVITFQTDNGLLADGIIGKHTVMMINNKTVENIPKLIQTTAIQGAAN